MAGKGSRAGFFFLKKSNIAISSLLCYCSPFHDFTEAIANPLTVFVLAYARPSNVLMADPPPPLASLIAYITQPFVPVFVITGTLKELCVDVKSLCSTMMNWFESIPVHVAAGVVVALAPDL